MFLLLLSFCSIASCKDVFEEDLAGMPVLLMAPADGWQGSQNAITFRWETTPGATGYQLQVASPDFDRYLDLTIDTHVTALQVASTLVPDTFTWRVRALNGSSHTAWYSRRFIIGSDGDLSAQLVPLVFPGANAYTQEANALFSWLALPDAERYVFEVHAGSWAGAAVHSDTLTVTSGTVAELAEGTYAWGVQGLNSTSTTQFAHRILTIDRTAPVAPVLLTPANNAALGDSLVQFTWTPGSDALGGAIDSMFLYTTGTQAPMRRIATNTGSHAEVLDTGTYSWLVRCHDGAGNSSATPLRSFTVQ